MKKVWWVLRIAVIVTASYCIFAPSGTYTLRTAEAQDAVKCNTNIQCSRNTEGACYCSEVTIGGAGCNGCFVPNGSIQCGSCSGGASGNN
jgi:hypothetical protein